MTKRQHDFCMAYVVSRNPREASIIAGYSETYSRTKSYTLLKTPAIKDKITTLSEKYYKNKFEEIGLTAIKNLSDVIEDSENRATQLNAIKYVLDTIDVTDKDSDASVIQIKVKLPHDL